MRYKRLWRISREIIMRISRLGITFCMLAVLACFPAPAFATDKTDNDLVLYTALTATTPQIPLWAAIGDGWPGNGAVRVRYWKTLDDLRGAMLAGKGDIWVGDLEGFAQAALRGAPVRLVAVTGWKKFYCVIPKTATADSLESLAAILRAEGEPLALAPRDSPALAILEAVKKRGGPSFAVVAMQPQQLMLEMLRGARRYALLPEPFVSSVLAKQPALHAAISLEEEFSRLYGGPARLPLVGVAVHARLAEARPEIVRELASAMQRHAARLANAPEAALAALPEKIRENPGDDVIRASLPRDMIHAVPAAEAREEIAEFLRMILPDADPEKLAALLRGPFLFGG